MRQRRPRARRQRAFRATVYTPLRAWRGRSERCELACPPARAEGFFGRLKMEFFYGRDWSGITLDEFADMLDAYLKWYRDARLKSDLGYKSPMQYRRDLGLIA